MAVKLTLTVDSSSLPQLQEGAKEILKHVKSDWNPDKLEYKVYTDGITNKLIGVWCGNKADQLLVRVYGAMTELFIDRNAEKKNMEVLNAAGLAPKLYAVFDNGICYGFTEGIPTTTQLIVQEQVWRAVTREMAAFHSIQMGETEKVEPVLFPKLRRFIELIPEKFDDELKQRRLDECGYSKGSLREEAAMLEARLVALGCPVVFSHNDILLGNIIWNETTGRASFIDYEYGAANYQPFDIGNHFNEYAGVDEVDYSRYPSPELQRRWLRNYLSHYQGKPGEEISEGEVEVWYVWANKFSLASNLFWGAWSLVQAYYSTIDFDFIEYGILRLNQYNKNKEAFLSLTPSL